MRVNRSVSNTPASMINLLSNSIFSYSVCELKNSNSAPVAVLRISAAIGCAWYVPSEGYRGFCAGINRRANSASISSDVNLRFENLPRTSVIFSIFVFPRGVNPGAICAGVMSDYFLRTVKASTVPAVIALRTPSGVFALTATLINALTFSIPESFKSVAMSDSVRLTNAANLRVVDFATWIESIFFACVRNCDASICRNFGVAVAGVAGVAGVDVDGVDGVRFVAIFLYFRSECYPDGGVRMDCIVTRRVKTRMKLNVSGIRKLKVPRM